MDIRTTQVNVDDIASIYVYDHDSQVVKPVLLLLHGAGSTKESWLNIAKSFAEKGFFVAAFDAYGYGESPGAGMTWKDPIDIFNGYRESSGYINRLIRELERHPHADAERVGLIGFSMGAHIIYHYLAKDCISKVKAAVPISGSPRWDNIVRRFILTMEPFAHLAEEDVISQYEERVASFHPLTYLRDFNALPLFILTGEKDERMPVDDLISFYNEVEKNYADKEKIALKTYPGVGHRLIKEMLQDSAMWMEKFLQQ